VAARDRWLAAPSERPPPPPAIAGGGGRWVRGPVVT
jgi:hypothetical protein